MPSFATEVKNELARCYYEDECCRDAELAALLRMGATLSLGAGHTFGLNFTSKNAAVARKVLQLLKALRKVYVRKSPCGVPGSLIKTTVIPYG